MKFNPTYTMEHRDIGYNDATSYRIEVSPRTPLEQVVRSMAAQGGGIIQLGPYTYTLTGTLNLLPGVSLVGVPGATKIKLDVQASPSIVTARKADTTSNRTTPTAPGMGPVIRVFTGARLIDCEVELVREGGTVFTRDEGDGSCRLTGTASVATVTTLASGYTLYLLSTATTAGSPSIVANRSTLVLTGGDYAAGASGDVLGWSIDGGTYSGSLDCNGTGGTRGAWITQLNLITGMTAAESGGSDIVVSSDMGGTASRIAFSGTGPTNLRTRVGIEDGTTSPAGGSNVARVNAVTFAELKALLEAGTTGLEATQEVGGELTLRETTQTSTLSFLRIGTSHIPSGVIVQPSMREHLFIPVVNNNRTIYGGGWGNCIVHCCEPFFQDRALDSGTAGVYEEDNGWQGTKYGPATVSGCVLNTKVSKTRGIFVSKYGVSAEEGSPDTTLSDGFINVNITNNTIIPMNAGAETEQACIYFSPGGYYGVCLGNICTAGDSAGTLGQIVYNTAGNYVAFGGEATSDTFVRTSSNCAKYSES